MPFTIVTFDYSTFTPDIQSNTNFGPLVASVPANSYADIANLCRTPPDQPGAFLATIGTATTSPLSQMAKWGSTATIYVPIGASPEFDSYPAAGPPVVQSSPRTMFSNIDVGIFLLFQPDATPATFFDGRILVRIYS